MTEGGVIVDKEYGMTTVDLNNSGFKDEPFVLAADVNQMLYVKDMSTKQKREKMMTTQSSMSQSATLSFLGKETLSELRTSQTCQAITKAMIEFRPS